jgi:flavorubredoxin
MTQNNNPREIYFNTEDIFSKISEILEKNGLQETPLDAALKEKESFTETILHLTRAFIVANISEKDLLTSVQKQLGITAATAQNIVKDLKEKIVPLAEKIGTEEKGIKEIEKEATIINPQKSSTEKKQIKTIISPTYTPISKTIEKKEKPIKSILEEQKLVESKKESRTGPDSYREPIE